MLRTSLPLAMLGLLAVAPGLQAQAPTQPKVQPGPVEPDWIAILEGVYRLDMFDDLRNPVRTTAVATPGLFRKAGPGPVTFRPEMALGLEAVIRGGYYLRDADEGAPNRVEIWSYRFKNTATDIERDTNLPPTLAEGAKVQFDPGDARFGLFIANDQFQDAVFSEPAMVAAHNSRLAEQPYKAMIYPYRDPKSGRDVPNSYLIGWEYSTNDDFQDVVCRIDNVELLPITAGADRD